MTEQRHQTVMWSLAYLAEKCAEKCSYESLAARGYNGNKLRLGEVRGVIADECKAGERKPWPNAVSLASSGQTHFVVDMMHTDAGGDLLETLGRRREVAAQQARFAK